VNSQILYTDLTMPEKRMGYFLVGIGLSLILISAVSVFVVFTGRVKPAPVFRQPGISLDMSQIAGLPTLPGSKPTPVELLSASALNDISNLTLHILLMGFIAGIGYKIALLGVQLLRPVEVKLKS